MARKPRTPRGTTKRAALSAGRASATRGAAKGAATPTPKVAAPPRAAAAKKRAVRTPGALAAAPKRPPVRPVQRTAFFADARHVPDELAEELGEDFVLGVTSGEDSEELYERERPEEEGGPFLETSGRTEFAHDVDESNPVDAEPAPWPSASPGQPPPHRPGGPR